MKAGDRVRVVTIPDWLVHDLPEEEVENLRAQMGMIHEVHEIQSGGYLWLSGWFALAPCDVELVESGGLSVRCCGP